MNRIFNNRASVFAAIIGTALDCYDLMLFTHFLFILVPLFFPPGESASLMGFTAFAIGTIFRPLGGTLFGHIGDKWGRKRALVLALFFSSLPTCFIGLLPSYAQIGFAATTLLIIFRIMQNVSMSGECPGAACILIEQSKIGHRAFASSLINVALSVGGIIATVGGYLSTKYLPEWGWRVPFLFSSLLGFLGFYIRYHTAETPIFKKVQEENKVENIPLLSVLRLDWQAVLCTFGLCAAVMAPSQVLYVYLGDFLKNTVKLEASEVMLVNTGIMFLEIFSLMFFGRLADRIGSKLVMMISAIVFSIVVYPLFKLINSDATAQNVIIAQIVIGIVSSGITAPLNVITSLLYPPGRRYTGCAFSWGVGAVIFAGCSPLICKLLEKYSGNPSAPGLFLMFCGILGALAIYYARHYQERVNSQVGVKFDHVIDSLDYFTLKEEKKIIT